MKNSTFNSKMGGRAFGALALTLLLPLNYALTQGTWTPKNDMPFFKNHHSAAASGDKIYLFGGGADLNSSTNQVYEYDPVADTFIAKAPMPAALCGAATVEAHGKIYLFGGYKTFVGEVSDEALEYDVANNSWKTLAPMTTARGYASAVIQPYFTDSNNLRMVVFGGGTAFAASALNDVEYYQRSTDTWTSGMAAPASLARAAHTAHTYTKETYIFGGIVNPALPAEENILIYNPIGGWGILDTMLARRVFHASCAIGDKAFVMGGMDNAGSPVHASVEMFRMPLDNLSNTELAPMLTARRAFAAAVVDKKIYVFGGNNESGVLKSVEVFDPGDLVAEYEPFALSAAELLQNTPNPFDEETLISFSMANSAQVDLSVFDVNGQKRATLVNQFLSPGTYTQRLSAGELETGVYYSRLLLDGFKPEVRKMVVVK